MNKALLEERAKFKKSFMAVHSSGPSSTNKSSDASSSKKQKTEKEKVNTTSAKAKLDLAQKKQMGGGGSQYKFGVLTKIVRHMRARHMDGNFI